MSASEEQSSGRSSAGTGVPSEKTLLAVIAIGFLILHILAGVILLRQPSEPAATQPVSLSSGD
jgi:hypothetical protein